MHYSAIDVDGTKTAVCPGDHRGQPASHPSSP